MKNFKNKKTQVFSFIAMILLVAIALTPTIAAEAHPPGANTSAIGMSLQVRDSSTHTPVSSVEIGDILEFVIIMSVTPQTLPAIAVNYTEGTLALKVGSGSYEHVAGFGDTTVTTIPEIGESTPFEVTADFTYTVNAVDIGAGGAVPGYIKFFADYGQTADYPSGTDGIYLFDEPLQDASATTTFQVFVELPDINITKWVSDNNVDWYDANNPTGPVIPVGDPVYFKVNISNKGNVELTGISVTDSVYGSSFSGYPTTLAPGAWGWSSVHSTTAAAGQHTNLATVNCDQGVTDDDPANYFGAIECINITKWVSDNNVDWYDANNPTGPVIPVGDPVYFKVNVSNCGNVDLTGISVTDSVYGSSFSGYPTTLAPGAWGWSSVHSTTAAAGQHTNLATVNCDQGVTDDDPANYFGADLCINITKWVSADQSMWYDANSPTGPVIPVGDPVYFKVNVTNCGNVELTGISVDDDTYGSVFTGVLATLAPGVWDESNVYSLPGGAVEGQHTNIANVTCNEGLYDEDPANYFGEGQEGCTHTQGYWKNHADPLKHDGKHYDDAWDCITPDGPDSDFFDTIYSYLEILNTPPKGGNAYLILAHQYIAAELNGCYSGTSLPGDIQANMTAAAALLDSYDTILHPKWGTPSIPSGDDRAEAIKIAYVLDEFNNGNLYWPHCDEIDNGLIYIN